MLSINNTTVRGVYLMKREKLDYEKFKQAVKVQPIPPIKIIK